MAAVVVERKKLEVQPGGHEMSDDMKTIIKLLATVCVLFLVVCLLAEGCHMLAR